MLPRRWPRSWVALPILLGAAFCAMAGGTLADYERAERLLPMNARRLVVDATLTPHWIGEAGDFWYWSAAGTRKQLVRANGVVDASACDKLQVCDEPEHVAGAAPSSAARELTSPDGNWSVFVEGYDLHVRDRRASDVIRLTTDGTDGDAYASGEGLRVPPVRSGESPPVAFFSPDSRKLLTYRLDYRQVPNLTLLETRQGQRSHVRSYRYAMPGDHVARASWMLFDLPTRTRIDLKHQPVEVRPNDDPEVRWSDDSSTAFFLEQQAGYKRAWIRAADASTGAVRTVLEETSTTYIDRNPILSVLPGGAELIWSSERDGWNHLYLVDARRGRIKNRITRGPWVVASQSLLHVDAHGRWVYFLGAGRESGRDPYYRHLYRAKLDGSRIELLTPENADHDVSFAPSGNVLIDTWSRVDQPPVTVLRAASGRLIAELQRADIGALLAKGWSFPERFSVKARDGQTDLYGVIFRPRDFDPRKSYPVVESIYPGPQMSVVPRSFTVSSAQAFAELGFIVVMMDGLGTAGRSRAFRDFSYGRLEEAGGLEDHIAGLRQLARRYPHMDLTRVGIYGHSGGGYAAARAILQFPQFYKVAVASAGNHDQRTYHAGWGEHFQGYPVAENYLQQANLTLASRLEGKLLLAYGTLDDNVDPANTLQLIDALIAANKNFDVLVLPNRNHRMDTDPYFIRKRWDYFVEHLLGVTSPPDYRISSRGAGDPP